MWLTFGDCMLYASIFNHIYLSKTNRTMKKVFISAGHSNVKGKDQGAISCELKGKTYTEGSLTVEFRKKLVKALNKLGIEPLIDNDANVTKDTVAVIEHLKLNVNDIAIDIHFNAVDGKGATGCEAIVPFKYTEMEMKIAAALMSTTSETLGIKKRGVITEAQSARGTLMFMRPNCENILLEVCFISNPNDLQAYFDNADELIDNLAKVIASFIEDKEDKEDKE